jgi:hypothetical protein
VKRVLLLALAMAACSRAPPPVIDSFTVDQPNPDVGAAVTFSYAVRGARTVSIEPAPGVVHASPVIVVPPAAGTFTLRATNEDGAEVTSGIAITLRPLLAINATDAIPGQVQPGTDVNLTWRTTSAERATLTDGATGQVSDVAMSGSTIVHPATTTIYTLTAYNKNGRQPASVTAKMVARVGIPPSVSNFVATPPTSVGSPMTQGTAAALKWSGNAVSYSITTDGGTTFNVGPRRSLIVRPAATTTYTLHATGPGGALTNPPSVTVFVQAQAAATLAYTPPVAASLQFIADPPCANPCTGMTFHIRATSTVQLRGLAFNLPLDTTKVSFGGFAPGSALAAAVSKATMGTGPLQDLIVIGIALEGTGTAPASDVTLNPGDDLGSFTLTLNPAGGVGNVFDGGAPSVGYKAAIQSAAGRTQNAIAIGKLDAQ